MAHKAELMKQVGCKLFGWKTNSDEMLLKDL